MREPAPAAAGGQWPGTELGVSEVKEIRVEEVDAPRKPIQGHHKPKPDPRLKPEALPRLFEGEKAFVMATGPSLNQEVVDRIYSESGWRYIGISDCYRICPYLDFMYACDTRWWDVHYEKVMEWDGARNGYWCTEQHSKKKYSNLRWINGSGGQGWSNDQSKIHYGCNSGFQITNIAYLLGIEFMVLLGFNMMVVGSGKNPMRHFFGDHPQGLSRNSSYQSFAAQFDKIKPGHVRVINATQPTKLNAFEKMNLDDAIESGNNWNRPEPD